MAAVRNHDRLKAVALLTAAFLFCEHPSLAASPIADRLFLARGVDVNWPLLVLLGLLGVGFALFLKFRERERITKIEELAASLGYTFRRKPTAADSQLPIGCILAETGRDPGISNVLEVVRTDELDFVFFDFQYTVGYGKSEHTTHQTIARMRSPLLMLPPFMLFPETVFSKIAVAFGQIDVDFPDSPDFSESYILRGGDEARIRAIFSPAVRQVLAPLAHLTIEGADDVLFIFRRDRLVKPEELASQIEEDKRILALFFGAQRQSIA